MVLWYDRVFIAEDIAELLKRRGALHALLFASLTLPVAMMTWMSGSGKYQSAGILDTSRVTVLQYAADAARGRAALSAARFVPWPLNIDYAWPIRDDWNIAATLLCGGLVALTTWAAFKRPVLGFLGGWWFVILAPTSSFAPIIDLAFEHRTYLSSIAPIGAGRLLRVFGRRPARGAIQRRRDDRRRRPRDAVAHRNGSADDDDAAAQLRLSQRALRYGATSQRKRRTTRAGSTTTASICNSRSRRNSTTRSVSITARWNSTRTTPTHI